MKMLQRLGWLGILALLGVAWMSSGGLETTSAPGEDLSAARNDSVEVKHELVSADVTREPTVRQIHHTPVTRSATHRKKPEQTTAGSRAMRVLLGDGRHRPQPFPTLERQH
jgi:hypothetical protein